MSVCTSFKPLAVLHLDKRTRTIGSSGKRHFHQLWFICSSQCHCAEQLLHCGIGSLRRDLLILEMYAPYTGLIKISSARLRAALAQLDD